MHDDPANPFDFPFAWHPTPEYLERSRLRRFMERESVPDYPALLQRSVAEPAWFWDAVVRDLDLQFYEPYRQVLDTSAGIEWTRWYLGGRCNYVHNAVDKWAAGEAAGRLAIRWEGEDGAQRTLTYGELGQ